MWIINFWRSTRVVLRFLISTLCQAHYTVWIFNFCRSTRVVFRFWISTLCQAHRAVWIFNFWRSTRVLFRFWISTLCQAHRAVWILTFCRSTRVVLRFLISTPCAAPQQKSSLRCSPALLLSKKGMSQNCFALLALPMVSTLFSFETDCDRAAKGTWTAKTTSRRWLYQWYRRRFHSK